jgi:hypothetical protein
MITILSEIQIADLQVFQLTQKNHNQPFDNNDKDAQVGARGRNAQDSGSDTDGEMQSIS